MHVAESKRRILRSLHKKGTEFSTIFLDTRLIHVCLINVEEKGPKFKDHGKNRVAHGTGIVNSCKGKNGGVLFCNML